jgi:hypothetical protein
MCKCSEKPVGTGCEGKKETVSVETEQTQSSNCSVDQHKSGECCSTKAA